MIFAWAGGCRGGRRRDYTVFVDCGYCGVVLSEKGEDERCGPSGQVVYSPKREGAEHGRDDRREEKSG